MLMTKMKNDYTTQADNDIDKIRWPVKSPIGYFGSKSRIAHQIIENMPPHNAWVEAFCGSAAITLAKKPAPIEVINDVDDQIVNLFDQLRTNHKKLCEQIKLTPYSRAEFQRARLNEPNLNPLERARRFLVASMMTVNATHASKSGFSASHSFTRSNKEARVSRWYNLPERLEKIVERLRTVRIENRDAKDILSTFQYRPATLVYLDPPYFVKRDHRYTIDANDSDFHEELLKICIKAKCMILISGYENELYNDLLTKKRGWSKITINAYTKGTNGKTFSRTEVLWRNEVCNRALNRNKVPIRLSAKEKSERKINPVRKFYKAKNPRF
jgi:DNA adenine methylase